MGCEVGEDEMKKFDISDLVERVRAQCSHDCVVRAKVCSGADMLGRIWRLLVVCGGYEVSGMTNGEPAVVYSPFPGDGEGGGMWYMVLSLLWHI